MTAFGKLQFRAGWPRRVAGALAVVMLLAAGLPLIHLSLAHSHAAPGADEGTTLGYNHESDDDCLICQTLAHSVASLSAPGNAAFHTPIPGDIVSTINDILPHVSLDAPRDRAPPTVS